MIHRNKKTKKQECMNSKGQVSTRQTSKQYFLKKKEGKGVMIIKRDSKSNP